MSDFSQSDFYVKLWLNQHAEVRFSGQISNANFSMTNCEFFPTFEHFPFCVLSKLI